MFLILWLLIILFLSIIPVRGPQINLPSDKITHFVVYGITAILFFRYLRLRVSSIKSIAFSIILASSYGLAMELLQSVLPWRKFSFSDEIANISGALFFTVIYIISNYHGKRYAESHTRKSE